MMIIYTIDSDDDRDDRNGDGYDIWVNLSVGQAPAETFRGCSKMIY